MHAPHGVWRISAYGKSLMLTQISGCCNFQGARAYSQELQQIARQELDLTRPWVTLTHLKPDCFTTPDVVAPMHAFGQWCVAHNRIALVTVLDSDLMEYEQRKMMVAQAEGSEFQYAPYHSIEDAVAHVNQLGITLPLEDYYQWLGIHRQTAEIIPLKR